MMDKVLSKCNIVYDLIHKPLFKKYYFPEKTPLFTKIFTSLDVIEDTQNAIQEFNQIPDNLIPNRSTLYIYGILQAMYCQQDGVRHLYQSILEEGITKKDKIGIKKLFKQYNSDIQIRLIRDNIAGHPADANYGKEFYFIAKGSNTKNKFTYAGYTPEFKTVDVDISKLINEQERFIVSVLSNIESGIISQITNHKQKFMNIKLSEYVENLEGCKRLIVKGINDSFFGIDTKIFDKELANLKIELNKRYFNNLPESVDNILNKINYILERINFWNVNNVLSDNIEVDIILESFEFQLSELKDILIEIDVEFKKH